MREFRKVFLVNLSYTALMLTIFIYATKFNLNTIHIIFTIVPLTIYSYILTTFKYKARVTINIIFIMCVFLVTMANSLHFIIKGQILTLSQVSLFRELLGVKDMIVDYINLQTIIICLIPSLWIFFTVTKFKFEKNTINMKFVFSSLCILLAINYSAYLNNKLLFTTIYSPNEYAEEYGLLSLYANEILPSSSSIVSEELDALTEVTGEKKEDEVINSLADKKNVVFITAESLDYAAIDESITPTLYKMFTNGMAFENYYTTNNYTNSSEFSILTSIPSPIDNTKIENYSETYESLPKLFSSNDFCTFGAHANTGEYYNRASLYDDLYHFQEKIFLEDVEIDLKNDWARDEEMFEESIDIIEEKDCEKNFVYFMSIYGHSKYNEDSRGNIGDSYEYVDNIYPEYDEYYKAYLAVNMSFDQMLSDMEQHYESLGELDDTVFIIVSDHYPYALGDINHSHGAYSESFINSRFDGSAFESYNVPFFIYDPSNTMNNREEYVSNIDVLPTVSDLFDLDYSISYGTSPFRENHRNTIEWFAYENFGILSEDITYTGEGEILNGDKDEVEKTVEDSKVKAAAIYNLFK